MRKQSEALTVPILLLAILLLATSGVSAQQTKVEGEEEPPPIPAAKDIVDWPCVQGKVGELTVAQIWDGPPIGDDKSWQRDGEISTLVRTISSRRVSVADAEKAIEAFAKKQPDDARDTRLTQLFESLFESVNNQRKSIISGIGKYQKAQRERAIELERQSSAIIDLEGKAQSDEAAAKELDTAREQYQWATRIFQDRQTNIPLACELPVLIEERLYALTRAIRGRMKG